MILSASIANFIGTISAIVALIYYSVVLLSITTLFVAGTFRKGYYSPVSIKNDLFHGFASNPNYDSAFSSLVAFIVASSILVLTLPVTLFVAIRIKLTDGGPIFVLSKEIFIGRRKRLFRFYAFRTINLSTGEVTPIGKVLRKYLIDRIPNMLNVLKGDISIVGRTPSSVSFKQNIIPKDYEVPEVANPGLITLPGIMGLDPVTQPNETASLDIVYVSNKNWLLDVRILVAAILLLVYGRNHLEGTSTKK